MNATKAAVAYVPEGIGDPNDPRGIKPRNLQLWDKITSWSLFFIMLKLTDAGHKNVSRMVLEYQRYMYLVINNLDKRIIMSEAVDPAWHMHIIFTRDYAKFCEEMAGQFLHHNPTITMEDTSNLADEYVETLRLYEEEFGKPDRRWWTPAAQVCTGNGNPGNCAH